MNKIQKKALIDYLSALGNKEHQLSNQQLINRVNLELSKAGQQLIHPKDPDVGMLFRRSASTILNATKANQLSADTQHDMMFNSCWKVAFESALAALIFTNKAVVKDVIIKTITNLEKIVLPCLSKPLSPADKALFNCYQSDANANHAYYARERHQKGPLPYPIKAMDNGSKIPKECMTAYYQYVFRTDNYDDTFEEKLTAIYNFADFVTRPHKFKGEMEDIKLATLTTYSFAHIKIDSMLTDWARYKKAPTFGWFDQEKSGNPSVSRQKRINITHLASEGYPNTLTIQNNMSGKYSGIWAVQGTRSIDVSNPYLAYVEDMLIPPFYDITGVGLWRPMKKTKEPMDRASLAMHSLDMPMIGGFSGGMGSFLLSMKWVGRNTTRESLTMSFFAAYSVMISKGYHSFHEVAAIAGTLGLWYRHGNYLSLIEESALKDLPDVKELVGRFDEQLKRASRTHKKHVVAFDYYKEHVDLTPTKNSTRPRRNSI